MKNLNSWLSEGPFTLALCSSFFGFYAHCGIVAALYEKGFVPSKITGSSAGALVGAALAGGMKPTEASELFFKFRKQDFWDPKPGFGYLKGEKFQRILESYFPSSFEKTQLPLEVAVVDLLSFQSRFLKSGDLPISVYASCAVPLMFHPARVNGRIYIDGGVVNKTGINPENKNERVLSVYLESRGLAGIYERKAKSISQNELHKVMYFKNPPTAHFNKMEKGPEIFAEMKKRASGYLFTSTALYSSK